MGAVRLEKTEKKKRGEEEKRKHEGKRAIGAFLDALALRSDAAAVSFQISESGRILFRSWRAKCRKKFANLTLSDVFSFFLQNLPRQSRAFE